MIVNSHNIEFGYELISIIPYANYLASIGELEKTISGNDTECLYFFSPKHEINSNTRSWHNTAMVNAPNIRIHRNELDKSQFLPPDYKKHYANDRFKFDKEIVIICNRHNTEWNNKPINYFDLPTLRKMFELLQDEYQVIYINIEGRKELYDNAPPEHLGDFELLKEYPLVINIHELHKKNKDLSFNTLQLMLFANCEKYITMNGGHAILASYFGGENIIMSKYGKPQAQELRQDVNSFYRWYQEFGGQRCVHVPDEDVLLRKIKSFWIDKDPIVNVLVRTSHRPNFFETCIDSILKQDYQNINIFVSIDDKKSDYTIKYPVYPVFVKPIIDVKPINDNPAYGRILPYNLYCNDLQAKCKSGLICFVDDDDKFSHNKVLTKIVNEYKKGFEFIISKVQIGMHIVPNDEYIFKEPTIFQISGCGIAFDVKYKDIAVWEPYKRGDFRVAAKLYKAIDKSKVTWLNEVTVNAQDGSHWGRHIDKPNKTTHNELISRDMEAKVKVKIISNKNKFGIFAGLKIGEIMELNESMARQYIKTGLAVLDTKDPLPMSKIVEPIKENKVIEPVKIEKVVGPIIVNESRHVESWTKTKRGRKAKK